MKVAIISLNFKAQAGGNRQIIELAKHLQAKGDAVIIYAPEINKGAFASEQSTLTVRRVPREGNLDWTTRPRGVWGKIARKVEQFRSETLMCRAIARAMDTDFDVINTHDYAHAAIYFYKKRNPRVRGVMMVCEPPYSYLPKDRWIVDIASRIYNRLMDVVMKKYFRAADAGVALAPYEKEWLEARGVPATMTYTGLDYEKFYHPVRNPPAQGEVTKLFAVGIPSKYRRYEDVLRAVHALNSEGKKVCATIVANNLWHEDAYCDYLKKLSKELGTETDVDFRFEGVSEEELRRLYDDSHIFVYTNFVPPGRNGATWALVVSEAQAAGMPVVLYKDTGAAIPLTDGKDALLAETEQWQSVRDKIKLLIDNPELFKSVALGGQIFVKSTISWDYYAKKMREVFQESAALHH